MRTPTRTLLALAGATALVGLSTPFASAETEVDRPDEFTSAFTVMATPDMIINADGDSVPGEEGATGTFNYMINSDEEIICYDLTLEGVTGDYESPAKTATHIHEAVAGEAGPPRLAFPNPSGDGDTRTSEGCLQGPFTTGVEAEGGGDTGEGFELSQIEDDPSSFFGDTHTADFAAGAVRGQLQEVPVGGVDAGLGGAAEAGTAGSVAPLLGLVGAGALALVVVAARRRAEH